MTLRLCLNSLGIFALARNRECSSPTCLAHKTWRPRALTNWELFTCANAVLWTSPRYSYIMVWISMSIFGFASPPTVNHNFLLLSANPNHSLLLTSAPLAPLEWVPSAISTATFDYSPSSLAPTSTKEISTTAHLVWIRSTFWTLVGLEEHKFWVESNASSGPWKRQNCPPLLSCTQTF